MTPSTRSIPRTPQPRRGHDNLYVAQPDTGEQALDITEALVRSGAIDVIAIDSVAALVPKAEIDSGEEMGEPHVALQACLMSQALVKLAGVVSKSNTSTVFINQLGAVLSATRTAIPRSRHGKATPFYVRCAWT